MNLSTPHLQSASRSAFTGERQAGPAGAEADAAQKIRQSIAFMQQHLDQPLQVSALAASANVSQSHYFALFKRFIGATPIDYFIRLRMQQACHLLKTTSASVKCVAAALGYDDPFYFSRVFRSVHGVAPREYRLMSNGPGILTADFRGTTNRLAVGVPAGYAFMANAKERLSGEHSPCKT